MMIHNGMINCSGGESLLHWPEILPLMMRLHWIKHLVLVKKVT